MIRLIRNEGLKIFKAKTVYILTVLLIALATGIVYFSDTFSDSKYTNDNWKSEVKKVMVKLEKEKKELIGEVAKMKEKEPGIATQLQGTIGDYEQEIAKYQYRLDKNIPPMELSGWQAFATTLYLQVVINMFAIVIASGMVAKEYAQGTIKFLMIRPVNRLKILFSKYIMVLLSILYYYVVLYLANFVLGAIFYGANFSTVYQVNFGENGITTTNMFMEVLKATGVSLIYCLVFSTIAFMLGTLARKNAVAIGLTLVLAFMHRHLESLIAKMGLVKVWLFTCLDKLEQATGAEFNHALLVVSIYVIAFLVITAVVFKKRDLV